MPRIQEYNTTQDAAEPQGQTSPMLEQVGDVGRGIQDVGRAFSEAGNKINQRNTQDETSDAYAAVADQRQAFMERIQNATNSGEINDEESDNSLSKIKQDYQDWVDDQADQYDTHGGKNAFLRASARAGGIILQHAATGATAAAGQKGLDDFRTTLNKDSNTVQANPHLMDQIRDNQTEYIQAQVDSGVWTPRQAEQIKKASDIEIGMSAVRGQMAIDYDNIKNAVVQQATDNARGKATKVDPNTVALNTAKAFLDGGHLDEMLDSDNKQKMYQEIKANQAAAQNAGILAYQGQANAKAAAGAKALSQAFEDIRTNKYDPKTGFQLAQQGLITPSEQLQLNKLSESDAEPSLPSNPRAFNNLMSRILSPDSDPNHISDPREMLGYVSSKGKDIMEPGSDLISADDYQKLTATLQGSGNQVNRLAEQQLYQKAQTAIGIGSPHQQFQLMQFVTAVQKAKQDAFNNKKPLSELFDPASDSYMGNKIGQYAPSAQELLAKGANDTLRGGSSMPTNVATKPGALSSAWNTISSYFSSAPAPVQAASAGAKAAPSASDIGQMSMAQLKGLNAQHLPPEEREAARRRYNQLHSQGAK